MERIQLKYEEEKKLINKMHEYLLVLRKLSKYTSEQLGNEIGVSRATMANFERNVENIRMGKAQYIALRTVLEARAEELIEKDNDDSLAKAIELVFYNTKYDENKIKIKEALTTAGAVCGVAGSISVGAILAPVITLVGGATIIGAGMGIAAQIIKGLGGRKNK